MHILILFILFQDMPSKAICLAFGDKIAGAHDDDNVDVDHNDVNDDDDGDEEELL